jgi:hypothetical protein
MGPYGRKGRWGNSAAFVYPPNGGVGQRDLARPRRGPCVPLDAPREVRPKLAVAIGRSN